MDESHLREMGSSRALQNICFCFVLLGMESMALSMPGKYSTTELYPHCTEWLWSKPRLSFAVHQWERQCGALGKYGLCNTMELGVHPASRNECNFNDCN